MKKRRIQAEYSLRKRPPAGSPARGALWALTEETPGGRRRIPEMRASGEQERGSLSLTEKGRGEIG